METLHICTKYKEGSKESKEEKKKISLHVGKISFLQQSCWNSSAALQGRRLETLSWREQMVSVMTDTHWSCADTSPGRQPGLVSPATSHKVGKDQAGLQVGCPKLVPSFQSLLMCLVLQKWGGEVGGQCCQCFQQWCDTKVNALTGHFLWFFVNLWREPLPNQLCASG